MTIETGAITGPTSLGKSTFDVQLIPRAAEGPVLNEGISPFLLSMGITVQGYQVEDPPPIIPAFSLLNK